MNNEVQDVLTGIQQDVPFNNVSSLFLLRGEDKTETFGGDCVLQAARTAERLKATVPEIKVTHHRHQPDGVHVVTIGDTGDHRWLLDPSTFQTRPIDVKKFERSDHIISVVNTFPIVTEGRQPSFKVVRRDDAEVTLVCTNQRGGITFVAPVSLKEATSLSPGNPPHDPKVASAVREALFLHVLDEQRQAFSIILDVLTQTLRARPLGGRSIEQGQPGYIDVAERIASVVGVTRRDVEEFLRDGLEIYAEIMKLS